MSTIPLGRYLWERIHQIGVRNILGVPGDFNLNFLDYIYDVPGLRWVGNANELNGAYAADGYGRVKGIPGVLVTTHGVGELSALNGIAGAHSEQVKVIHVVGQTTRAMQRDRMLIHHAISSDPDHQVYNKMSKLARCAEAELQDIKTAPAEIDRVIRECFIQSRPVYIFLPLDLSLEHVDAALLEKPIDTSLPVNNSNQDVAVKAILEALSQAKNPCVFVDVLVQRHGAVSEAKRLVDALKLPVYTSNMGKGIIDETNDFYVGTLNGKNGAPGVFDGLKSSDLVLLLGDLPADTNTGGFSRGVDADRSVVVNVFDVVIKGKKYENTFIKPILQSLLENIPSDYEPKGTIPQLPSDSALSRVDHKSQPANAITQTWIWHEMIKFLRPEDVLIADTGTASFGLVDTKFPCGNIRWTAQTYYGSIGWATPAALGSEIALEEMQQEKGAKTRGRTILVTGDGSLALTIQEIGTMITRSVKPIIFIINNKGYTIERVIHGAKQQYNDINQTAYAHLLPLFNHPSPQTAFRKVSTKDDFLAVLEEKALAEPKHVEIVEVVMDMLDVPWRLLEQIAMRGPESVKELKEAGFME
ncbi:pyruvate decarboxylase [Saccharata proteae CBS 121410]|uniref:Pyruvate decarboxylase n=1 Tax=Saccharata proteae CBS 121410 TaxID=1314787 RepID=A0A9P4I1L9_9PEZI|nr:pyruvate decarboxylase [Saccharata proteae CBS 121410]